MRGEAVSNRGPSAYQPNALPLGQTGSYGPVHGQLHLDLCRQSDLELVHRQAGLPRHALLLATVTPTGRLLFPGQPFGRGWRPSFRWVRRQCRWVS